MKSTRPDTHKKKMITSSNTHGELSDTSSKQIYIFLSDWFYFFPVEDYEEYSRHAFVIEINGLVFQATAPNSELSSQWQSFHSPQWALDEIHVVESDDLHFQMQSVSADFKFITIIFLLYLFKMLFNHHGVV